MSCTPPAAAGDADPCAAQNAGLVCNGTSDGGPYSFCTIPGQFEKCLPSPGCGTDPPGLTCQNNSALGEVCLISCGSSASCPDEFTACLDYGGSDVCYYDLCSDYYGSCPNLTSSDGFCLPVLAGGSVYGFCQAGGAMAAGTLGCATYRTVAEGTSDICSAGTTCVEDNVSTGTICLSVCGDVETTSDGGPGCSASDVCVSVGGLYGACFQSCVPSQNNCPTGTSCLFSGSAYICAP